MRRLLLLALLAFMAPSVVRAQRAESPIANALYLALGTDPPPHERYRSTPLALSAGLERTRLGSRWAIRFGADYMLKRSAYSGLRWEEFAAGVSVRYGRSSGAVRPYLLGGIGIADLRTNALRIKGDFAYQDVTVSVDTVLAGTSRWNGVLTPGLGTDILLGRVRLFTEARINYYPRFLTDRRRHGDDRVSKALFLGVKL